MTERAESETKKSRVVSGILYAALGVLLVAGLGTLFSSFHRDWYAALNKPPFTPPDAVFGVAWSVLYLAAGVSLAFALVQGANRRTVLLYSANGLLNVLWTLFFFTCKSPVPALVVLVMNVAAALLLLKSLFPAHKLSGWLLVPYTLWIIFALVLNYSIIMLN